MPKSNVTISAPLREALLECFESLVSLVRSEVRHQLVLVGGVASIAHSSVFKTEDVDVAGPPGLLIEIWEAVTAGVVKFSFEPDGQLVFDASINVRIRVDLIEVGGGCIERIHATDALFGGSVASVSALLILRAVAVVDRGSEGDIDDFKWLLWRVARRGQLLPVLDN